MSRTDLDKTETWEGTMLISTVSNFGSDSQYTYPTSSQPSVVRTLHRVRTGFTTPNFLTLKHRSDVLPCNFYFLKEDITAISGKTVNRTAMMGYSGPTIETIVGSGILPFPSESDYEYFTDWASVDAQVRTKILLQLKDQKVNLLQAYAEREQTAALLISTARRLISCVISLRNGDFFNAARQLGVSASTRQGKRYHKRWAKARPNIREVVADGWLELQYGWKPLLQDLYGSAEAIAQAMMHEQVNRVEASVKKQYKSKQVVPGRIAVGANPTMTIEKESTIKRKMVIAFSVASSPLHTLSQVGLTNPALIAWEMLPFSFVVDWFLPFGNFLSSFDACLGLKFVSGLRTDATDYLVNVSAAPPGNDNMTHRLDFCSAFGQKHRVKVERVPLGEFPDVALPQLKNPVSFPHVENALALLSQVFSRK